ncbi:response regulator transcription factor [Alphaproteobacteria bacterium endosymbiont of Tiliacea citrago]|uniref:response regulator transcription factor n=1 Tax=Alphaproteobacteria bacterium endosymbiont of Tiliacea citrago TaxID=3077944 RepID=UPI00313BCABD
MRVLVVEDDKIASNMITKALRKEGFTCNQTDLAEDALKLSKLSDYDIVLLDLMLPDSDGFEVIRRLRSSKNDTPIVVLSALQGINDKVTALSKGADDFLCKPISTIELIARLRAVARRKTGFSNSVITVGDLSVNLQTKSVTVAGAALKLTNKEYSILEILILKQGHILNKESFLSHLYDESCLEQPGDKIVDVFMCKLRKKIQQAHPSAGNYIETVWGRGYMLVDPETKRELSFKL